MVSRHERRLARRRVHLGHQGEPRGGGASAWIRRSHRVAVRRASRPHGSGKALFRDNFCSALICRVCNCELAHMMFLTSELGGIDLLSSSSFSREKEGESDVRFSSEEYRRDPVTIRSLRRASCALAFLVTD